MNSATSPVPGGRSTTRVSSAAQCTSVMNCSSALCSIGPRQMTAWSSRAKNPIETNCTPCARGGTMTSSMSPGGWSTPSMRGSEKPHTSASRTPTRWPPARRGRRPGWRSPTTCPPHPSPTDRDTRVVASVNGFRARGAWRRLGRGVDDRERVGRRVAAQHRGGAGHLALVHRSPLEGDRLDAGLGEQRRRGSGLRARRAATVLGERERQADLHPAVVAVDAGEDPELDDREALSGSSIRRSTPVSGASSGMRPHGRDFHYGHR